MNQKWIKILLSIFIAYHFTAMMIFPNPFSVMARVLWPYISMYGNQMGLNTTWQFFSPAPTPPTYFRYTVLKDQSVEETADADETFFYPQTGAGPALGMNEARLLSSMRYFSVAPERLEHVLGPYLCKQHPGARQLNVQHVMEFGPRIEQLRYGRSFLDYAEKVRMNDTQINCSESQ